MKTKNIILVILVIIVIAILAVAGVFAYKYYFIKKTNNSAQNNIATQIASQVENWSLYKEVTNKNDKNIDADCGDNCKITENQLNDYKSKLVTGNMKVLNVNNVVYIYMTPNYENWTASQFPFPLDGIANKYPLYAYSDKLLWVTGCNGQEISSETSKKCSDTSDAIFTYFKNKNQNQQTNNAQSTDKTAGWKTYINDQYGFEINYPDTWDNKIGGQGKMGEFSLLSLDMNKNSSDFNINRTSYVRLVLEDKNFNLGTRDWKKIELGQIKGSISYSATGYEIIFVSNQGQNFYISTKNNPETDDITKKILSNFKFTK